MRTIGKFLVCLCAAALAMLTSSDRLLASVSTKFDAWALHWNSVHIPLVRIDGVLDVRQERQVNGCNMATWPSSGCVSVLLPQVKAFAAQFPGHHYVIGDEYTGHCVNHGADPYTCQRITPEMYGAWYHQFVTEVSSVDSTARFSPAGLGLGETGVAEQFRLWYLSTYGAEPPVTEWRFHGGDYVTWAQVDYAAGWAAARGKQMVWVTGMFQRPEPDLSAHLASLLSLANADPRIAAVTYFSLDIGTSAPGVIYTQHNLVDPSGNLTPAGSVYYSYSVGAPSQARHSVAEIGDFDGDGRADYADHNLSTGAFSIHLNAANGSFHSWSWGGGTTAAGANWDVLVADFTGDGRADYADLYVPTGQVWVHANNGNGTFSTANWGYADMADGGDYEVMAADINGDNFADLIERQLSTGLIWFTPNTTSSGSPFVNAAVRKLLGRSKNGPEWRIMLGDFTGDGKADYADQYVPTGHFWIHRNTGGTEFHMDNMNWGSGQASAGGAWRTMVGDFTGDGWADYADLWADTGSFWLHANLNNRTFVPPGQSSGYGAALGGSGYQVLASR
jgi:hypothetical protein